MWENILVTGLILNFGCNNTLLSEGHNMVSSQENSGSNTLYKNKLHLWIWMTTFGRSTKSWSVRSPQLHQQDKKHSERMILCKLQRMLLGTGQRNLKKVLKQLEGFLTEAHYCRNTSQVSKRRQTFIFEKTKNAFFQAKWLFWRTNATFLSFRCIIGQVWLKL